MAGIERAGGLGGLGPGVLDAVGLVQHDHMPLKLLQPLNIADEQRV